jgi:hypothetical protein
VSALFVLFWISFGLFVGDVLIGKFSHIVGVRSILSDVGQFLMLAASAAFLTAECLRREARKKTQKEGAEDPVAPT